MRVLVCGGRDFTNQEYVTKHLWQVDTECSGISRIIHGGCRGADWLAHQWISELALDDEELMDPMEVPVSVYKADWDKHGKAAGPIRNQQMLDEGKPNLVLAFAGGKGTDDMCRRAREAGVEVRRFWPGKS